MPARGGDTSTAPIANREAVRNLWRMNLLVLAIKGIVCGTVCRGRRIGHPTVQGVRSPRRSPPRRTSSRPRRRCDQQVHG